METSARACTASQVPGFSFAANSVAWSANSFAVMCQTPEPLDVVRVAARSSAPALETRDPRLNFRGPRHAREPAAPSLAVPNGARRGSTLRGHSYAPTRSPLRSVGGPGLRRWLLGLIRPRRAHAGGHGWDGRRVRIRAAALQGSGLVAGAPGTRAHLNPWCFGTKATARGQIATTSAGAGSPECVNRCGATQLAAA